MDTNGKDNFGQEKRNEDLFSYTSPNISSDWRFGEPNLTNTSIPTVNPIAVYKGAPMEASSSSSPPMLDSFCPTIWDHPTNTSNLGFSDINLQHIATNSNSLGIRRGPFGPLGVERNLDVGWAPPSSMVKGNVFLPSGPGLFSQSLSNFPADSAFIERAARFSCFGKGNFSDAMNSYGISESTNPYERGTMVMQGTQDVLLGSELKSLSGEKSQRNELNTGEGSKNACLSVEPSTNEGSPLKKSNSFVQSHDKAKQGGDVSGNESDEAEFSGGGGGGGGGGGEPSSSKAIGLKKRKRDDQDNELGKINEVSQPPSENSKDNMETQHKGDQTPVSTNKAGGKHGKQGSQASDSPKEEYIHVRARRGQATNSHSLAERVRREKISERMKFLQDLVPGCSKVTGKAVMLDEIINYVQSLQRQVEFLSMKLATVNPRLDFNLGGLLTKDILQPRAGPSSSLGYSPDMTMPFPPSYASQPGLVQSCLPGIANSSDALRRSITTQLTAMSEGYKQLPQVPNMWVEDELHNVVQMGLNSSAPLDNQDLNVCLSQGHMKVEL